MNLNPLLPDIPDNDYLMHYGVGKLNGAPGPGSGRYPLGSGEHGNQRMDNFRNVYEQLKKQKLTEKEIADAMGMSTTLLRSKISTTKEQELAQNISTARELKDRGYGPTEIGRRMGGVSEATVRGWLAASERERRNTAKATSDMLVEQLKEKGVLDVGAGTEKYIGVSKTMLNTAVNSLKEQGYNVYEVQVPQLGMPGKYTTVKVLANGDVTKNDIYKNLDSIKSIEAFSDNDGQSFRLTEYPQSISSSRVKVRYAEEGGIEKDGVMELRPGVADLDLQGSHYAQVRIAVDGTHYLKGMAVYGDPKDFPKGVDVIFNTNKHVGTPMMSPNKNDEQVLKTLKNDPDLPFGAVIKAGPKGQYYYEGPDGKMHLGAINKVNDEGDWGTWSKSLSSQFLSKQSLQLIKSQLDLSYADKVEYFDSIMKMDNHAVRQNLLDSFASKMDSSAVDLKAAALPGQQSHVLLPIPSLKPNEIYAPNYKDGTEVILIRYPHGGIFEIPQCVVNNRNAEAKRVIGPNSKDAVGINSKVAEQLSGADFDGDSALVIPNRGGRIKTAPYLEDLKNFDPKSYKVDHETITGQRKQQEMGKVSNLITDMTLRDAPLEDICRAVKHSMVVIDSEKHKLDWQQSEKDFGIKELKVKYQGGADRGASTLISKASSEAHINERETVRVTEDGSTVKSWRPNSEGEWLYRDTGRMISKPVKDSKGNLRLNPDGSVMTKQVQVKIKTTKMAATTDARTLSSGTQQENLYADYANKLKALANKARKESLAIKSVPADPNAKKVYAKEVASLEAKLTEALKNSPRERQAQILANVMVKARKLSNPEILGNKDQLKKINQQSLATARARVGANKKKVEIEITPGEWEAIKNRAISTTKLKEILKNTNMDKVKEYASPKTNALSSAKVNRIRALSRSGYTNAEIAEAIGVSASTVQKYL